MTHFDVFNGDADGICALHQLRLSQPIEATRITGVKRDIALLARVEAEAGDHLTVLDISLDKNRIALQLLLDKGCEVDYFDHHFAGDIPQHPNLHATIDTSASTCTSLLVNAQLKGAHLPWAVVGAFGDNLYDSARRVAEPLRLDASQLERLSELGTYLNYNGYGLGLSDLLFHPEQLFLMLRPYKNPFDFIESEPAFRQLERGFREDMAAASALPPEQEETFIALYLLPDLPWARRVSGVFGNQLARDNPDRAHALLTKLNSGGYRISVRAPLNNREGADTLCRAFPTGGGRKAAAGINQLPNALLGAFVDKFREIYAAGNL
ncbi:MAG: acetyltransferase [Gammaproteobacteria bacterium]|nr:acetyltransferase [Gammaproteobacteria bacterium]